MSLDLNALLEESNRLSTDGSAFLDNFVKMPEGNGVVVVRLLPPAASGKFERKKSPFYQFTRIHRLNNKSFHCLKSLVGGKWVGECPICRYYNWLWQESDKKSADEQRAMQSQARLIKPIERYYYNTIVRQVSNPVTQEVQKNVGPKILSIGKTLHKMIVRAIVGSEELQEPPLGDVTDVVKGRDLKIVKQMRQSGRESYPNYSDSRFMDSSPLGSENDVSKWLDELHDLAALRTIVDAEELKKQLKIHLGLIPDDSASEFDPSEFQKNQASQHSKEEDVVVSQESTSVSQESTSVSQESTSVSQESAVSDMAEGGDTEPVADDDFLAELRDIG